MLGNAPVPRAPYPFKSSHAPVNVAGTRERSATIAPSGPSLAKTTQSGCKARRNITPRMTPRIAAKPAKPANRAETMGVAAVGFRLMSLDGSSLTFLLRRDVKPGAERHQPKPTIELTPRDSAS